jgi:predicted DNA-binding protein
MSTNVATNIRLPEEVLKTLKYRAIEEKKSVNQLIKEAVQLFLTDVVEQKKSAKDHLENIIGIAESGVKDGSVKHNYYLYNNKK